ncbi:hypothetical protein [Hymenobacter sp. DG25B]
MGPADHKSTCGDTTYTCYTYRTHPFASDDICLTIGPDSVVTGISHGD